jgi:hypothetical protein
MTRTAVVARSLIFTLAANGYAVLADQRPAMPRDARAGRAGNSVLSGTVFDAGSGAPLRGARVWARNRELSVEAITDDQGRYALNGLAAGDWLVTVSKGGYFNATFGQRSVTSFPKITVGERQQVTTNFSMARGGVITGRVSDETGEPLSGLRVRVYRPRIFKGYPQLDAFGAPDFTDDRGTYRIHGLPPGEYIVAASLRVAPADQFLEDTYAPTYFPGTGDLANAQRVSVTAGSEVAAMFPLLPIRFVRVTGVALTSWGAPANAFISLASDDDISAFRVGGVTREDGTFTLSDVPPGKYVLSASLRSDEAPEVANLPITVGNSDMAGVTVVTAMAPAVHGRIVADAGVSRPVPSGLTVIAVAARAGEPVLSSDDGPVFSVGDLAEPFYLRVGDLPDPWVVKRVIVNDTDVTDARISPPTAQTSEAQIVITDRITTLSGTVTAGVPMVGTAVIVLPEDQAKWTYPSSYIRTAYADPQSRFRITGLPPGARYLAVATSYLEEGEQFDPAFLSRMRDVASRLELEESATRTIDLKVIER